MTKALGIKSKIASVKSIQKITSAMQMVSASKMRKAQERMKASRPYADKILEVVHHLATAHPEYRHPYMQEREVKRVGYIVITTDRGLCGALNLNVLKTTLLHLQEWSKKNVEQDLCVIGNKADSFFRRIDVNIVAKAKCLEEQANVKDLIGIVKVMLDAYSEGRIDELYLSHNKFISTMVQRPVNLKLLPLVPQQQEKTRYWDYIYEPDAKLLMDQLLNRNIEIQVYQGVVDNLACEQSARMLAMMNATDNAGKLIDELQLKYNKSRQAAITQEITEIVSGAGAIK
ncbi:MAG: F0F1 ATP synthase subunit gamma [Gammaproteobacteria bacterium]|jgi:F-type H+-transporting ATPase subunit gamma